MLLLRSCIVQPLSLEGGSTNVTHFGETPQTHFDKFFAFHQFVLELKYYLRFFVNENLLVGDFNNIFTEEVISKKLMCTSKLRR